MLSQIPESHQAALAEALTRTFGKASAVEALEPLRGGQSGALIFRLRVGARDHALRIGASPNPMDDPAIHFACMEAAAHAGIAPAVLYADPAHGLAITGFITQQPLRSYAGSRAELMAELAAMTRALQAIPAPSPFPAPARGNLDAADAFIADLEATGFFHPDAIGEHVFRFRQMREVWPTDIAPVPSHNDLNPGNILYDGQRIWFVDWAAASANDPFGDPACLANAAGATEEEEALLLAAWLGRAPDRRETARFHLMRLVWPMVQAVLILKGVAEARPDLASPAVGVLLARSLSAVHADIGAGRLDMTSPEGRLDYGKALLDELLANLRAPRFGKALHLLAA
jgi:aminoglycoside phosphotransferase (APT) family kinase protein